MLDDPCHPRLKATAMHTRTVTAIYSPEFLEIQTLFHSLKRPYGAGDITRFNLAYSRMYPRLNRQERRRAEAFVDLLIAGL